MIHPPFLRNCTTLPDYGRRSSARQFPDSPVHKIIKMDYTVRLRRGTKTCD